VETSLVPDKANSEALPQSRPLLASFQSLETEGGLKFGKLWLAIRRKSLLVIIITLGVTALAAVKAVREKPVYKGEFEILTKAVTAENEVISTVPQTLGKSPQPSSGAETLDKTKIKVLLSPSLLNPVVSTLKTKYPEMSYGELFKNLKIETKDKDILTIDYSNENPVEVKDVLDAVGQAYLRYSLEDRRKDIRQGILFVEQQLPKLESQVNTQQAKLQKLRLTYNFIDPDTLAKQYDSQMGTVSQQRIDNQSKLNETRLLHNNLVSALTTQSPEMAGTSALSDNTRYQKLLGQLSDVDNQIAQASAIYQEDNPKLSSLREQRKNLAPLLQLEAKRVEQNVLSRIQEMDDRGRVLNQSTEELNRKVRQLSSITRQYTDIQRDLKIATENLSLFLAKREGLRIDASQQQVPWQLLTPPGKPELLTGSLQRTVVLGMLLGLMLGVGTALSIDKLGNVIYSTEDIKDISNLPILGIIPFNSHLENSTLPNELSLQSSGQRRSEYMGNRSAEYELRAGFLEAFRSTFVNVRLISPDAPLRTIVVSSPTSGNGKTTAAINLATAAAAMGQRVLLVDADLRRPTLHERLGLIRSIGLTDLITTDLELQDVVQRMSWEDNLYVLSAGTVPPDPSRILSSKVMQDFVAQCREQFDLVIFDTTPLLGLADPYLLSEYTDGILMVVPLNQLKRSVLAQALESLSVSSISVLGIVANASQESLVSYHNNGYYRNVSYNASS
jgi:polysaccharide biosynthesis transport protein